MHAQGRHLRLKEKWNGYRECLLKNLANNKIRWKCLAERGFHEEQKAFVRSRQILNIDWWMSRSTGPSQPGWANICSRDVRALTRDRGWVPSHVEDRRNARKYRVKRIQYASRICSDFVCMPRRHICSAPWPCIPPPTLKIKHAMPIPLSSSCKLICNLETLINKHYAFPRIAPLLSSLKLGGSDLTRYDVWRV
jgi:hypothetical protein